jgi:hypothetical protein
MAQGDHWLPSFNFKVEEWDAEELNYETLAICRTLAFAHAEFKVAIEEKPASQFMIRSRTRVVQWHPEGDCESLPKAMRAIGAPQRKSRAPLGRNKGTMAGRSSLLVRFGMVRDAS